MEIKEYKEFKLKEIFNLYEKVLWTNYTENIEMLTDSYKNSLYIAGAYENDKLVGIVRVVGDGHSIVYVQDIIVLPEYQRNKIGTKLLKHIIEKYKNVYQMILTTDNTEKTKKFYESLGFKDLYELDCKSFMKI
ncbi:GNAT family N-acetyltransferase [Oceanivirga salmonicida]|uniref:GNAT family N-acetyltransferase n=1 Tax=Oceanivirga salmonicida TaxID=1769291 RepID=UPI000831C01D|nr:GNAT family N-acetyltransferase [Oceanivirga salmonicida]